MNLLRSNQCIKLIELRHRVMGLNMTFSDTQSQVQSKYKARHVRVIHRCKGFSLRPKRSITLTHNIITQVINTKT